MLIVVLCYVLIRKNSLGIPGQKNEQSIKCIRGQNGDKGKKRR
jgi:hypothetical protein